MRTPEAVRKAVPTRVREARFRLQRLGPAGFLRYRRLERPERRKPRPRAGQAFDLGGGAFVLHATTVASVISHWVEYGHGIEELTAFKRLAPEHGMFLDIGAAEGIYSAAFCALTGRPALAFEPSPEMYRRLDSLCRLNPSLAIEAVNVALGKTVGRVPVSEYPDGQFSVVAPGQGEHEVMAVTTLDAFVEGHPLEPDWAKIDVEGMELDVLRGGDHTFRTIIRTIVLEVHYDLLAHLGHTLGEVQALLEEYGFRLETLNGVPVEDLDRFARDRPELLPGYTIVVCRKAFAH